MKLNGNTILLNARGDTANTVDGLWGLVRYRRHAWHCTDATHGVSTDAINRVPTQLASTHHISP